VAEVGHRLEEAQVAQVQVHRFLKVKIR